MFLQTQHHTLVNKPNCFTIELKMHVQQNQLPKSLGPSASKYWYTTLMFKPLQSIFFISTIDSVASNKYLLIAAHSGTESFCAFEVTMLERLEKTGSINLCIHAEVLIYYWYRQPSFQKGKQKRILNWHTCCVCFLHTRAVNTCATSICCWG